MSITFSIKNTDTHLLVKALGKDDDIEDVMNYGMSIIKEALATNSTKILCDETELEYALGTIDTYESAKFISEYAPKIAKIAIVCKPEQIKDAEFFSTVAVNRGLHIKAFKRIEDAERWLGVGVG